MSKKNKQHHKNTENRSALQGSPSPCDGNDLGFYRAFEERFRGPRSLIKDRLKAYLPFVTPLLKVYPSASVLDLGCGRGEWLELMREEGFVVQGVDLDQGMLEACIELGLSVVQEEAVGVLKTMDAESCSIVSGFHIAEHIPFEALRELVAEALRVLLPGGLLILETPNPENLVVGTCGFYMDPTHRQPLPPELLCFLPEYYGFACSKILRLQEAPYLMSSQDVTLQDVLVGVSPDYAVVAQKKAPEDVMSLFKGAFEHDRGVTLGELARRYYNNTIDHFEQIKREQSDISLQVKDKFSALSEREESAIRQLREEAKKLEVLEAQLKEVSVQAAEERTRLELLQPRLEGVEAQNRQLREEAKKLEVLEAQLKEVSVQAAEERTCLELLQPRLESVEAQNRQLREEAKKVELLQAELKEVSLQTAEERTRLELLQPRLEGVEAQNRQFREEAKKVGVLEAELKEVSVQAAEGRARLELLQPRLESVEAQNRQLREEAKKVGVLEAELKEVSVQAADERTRLELLQPRLEGVEAQNRQLLEEAKKVEVLEAELKEAFIQAADHRASAEQLTQMLVEKDREVVAVQSEIEQLHSHSQGLQNEWNAAKAKVEELNHSSHHWWTVADELNHELKAVYKSKSWRITWPLRKLMQLLMWLLWLPINLAAGLVRIVRWFFHGSFAWLTLRPGSRPRRTARLALLHMRNWVLLRPRAKTRILSILKRFPRLLAWLRRLHYANPTQETSSQASSVINDVPLTFESSLPADTLQNLTPRTRKIYADLQLAVARRQQESD